MKPLAASRKKFYIIVHGKNHSKSYLVKDGKGAWPWRTALKLADEVTKETGLVCSIHC